MLPNSPTTVTKTIPSYLYVEYNDDDALQAFILAYNTLAQQYLDWFNAINLPIYTGPLIVGALLDWVGQGVYGIRRPVLRTGIQTITGLYNDFLYNQIPYNVLEITGSVNYVPTTDDIYKRILTWSFYKGDGFQFSIPWLKRRIQRFLNGVNGTDAGTDQTYPVSVSFGANNAVTIDLTAALANPVSITLQEAIQQNAVPLPFQYTYTVLV